MTGCVSALQEEPLTLGKATEWTDNRYVEPIIGML